MSSRSYLSSKRPWRSGNALGRTPPRANPPSGRSGAPPAPPAPLAPPAPVARPATDNQAGKPARFGAECDKVYPAAAQAAAMFDTPEDDLPAAIELPAADEWVGGQQVEATLPGKLEQQVWPGPPAPPPWPCPSWAHPTDARDGARRDARPRRPCHPTRPGSAAAPSASHVRMV